LTHGPPIDINSAALRTVDMLRREAAVPEAGLDEERLWRLYSKSEALLPNGSRVRNLLWRMNNRHRIGHKKCTEAETRTMINWDTTTCGGPVECRKTNAAVGNTGDLLGTLAEAHAGDLGLADYRFHSMPTPLTAEPDRQQMQQQQMQMQQQRRRSSSHTVVGAEPGQLQPLGAGATMQPLGTAVTLQPFQHGMAASLQPHHQGIAASLQPYQHSIGAPLQPYQHSIGAPLQPYQQNMAASLQLYPQGMPQQHAGTAASLSSSHGRQASDTDAELELARPLEFWNMPLDASLLWLANSSSVNNNSTGEGCTWPLQRGHSDSDERANEIGELPFMAPAQQSQHVAAFDTQLIDARASAGVHAENSAGVVGQQNSTRVIGQQNSAGVVGQQNNTKQADLDLFLSPNSLLPHWPHEAQATAVAAARKHGGAGASAADGSKGKKKAYSRGPCIHSTKKITCLIPQR
ncbi:hypothetical protein IWW50_005272, partial [Coemansia erecta]